MVNCQDSECKYFINESTLLLVRAIVHHPGERLSSWAMSESNWQFFIDVGGTFTDVVARAPGGRVLTYKLLSSGAIRGVVEEGSSERRIVDPTRVGDPARHWQGYTFRLLGTDSVFARVAAFHADEGVLELEAPFAHAITPGSGYELVSGEEAPITAIRYLMGLKLTDPIGEVDIRLGTTRATNALLERKGAKTAFVTTRGFADVLRIGYQDRPRLFDSHIKKRDELATGVLEINERLAADGSVLVALDEAEARKGLTRLREEGFEAVAIALLHSYVNPTHERVLGQIAKEVSFAQVSLSSQVLRLERIVSRGDTTVADAYLSPVLQSYVASIRRSVPEARFFLMTSNGGLVDASVACGRDTILSGPAGGVVGCAHVTKEAGFDRAIGFDMGGTSTDVSRIDLSVEGTSSGGFEYQHETVKAGVRIMTPMLAIETVAAGGGSVCRFDGQKLAVGPESAGADPGPACYGRGGPLTVTDMNVFLGRVPAKLFPFPLDSMVIGRKLDEIRSEMEDAGVQALSRTELAKGFLRIANANMAAPIKEISIARGYDLRDYVLTSFGGAGGQHACAIARMLGIKCVLLSPFAGVLSALGIGAASVKRVVERSVQCELPKVHKPTVESLTDLEGIFVELERDATQSMIEQGVSDGRLEPAVRFAELCYAGQSSLIAVHWGDVSQLRREFEAKHRQFFGHIHEKRAVEVRMLRVELVAAADEAPTLVLARSENPPHPVDHAKVTFAGNAVPTPIYARSELYANHTVAGPAVITEGTSTVVIEPDWCATVQENGDLLLEDTSTSANRERIDESVDPVQLELFNNQFASIAEQMGSALRRSALSTNVKERLDFSCAIFTPNGELVVNAPHIPVHLGSMSDCVKALIEDVESFHPGDVYVTNDPYRGGSHLNDVTVVTPVYEKGGGRLLFFVASRAHHAEIGGKMPGSMPPDSTSLAEEGVVIRAFPYLHEGRPREAELRSLLTAGPHPTRSVEENIADIAAQVAANQTGIRELTRMVERYGSNAVLAYMGHIRGAAEAKMRAALRILPDGVRMFEDRLDDGTPLCVTVDIHDDEARVDFTGTGEVLHGNLNANRAIVSSAVLYCLRCLIAEDIPLNSGVLAPVEIVLPTCFLNPLSDNDPAKCPAVAGGNVETSQRIVDAVFGALGVVAASQGTMNNLLMGDEQFGYYETICGGAGAGDGFDGADAVHTHMTNTRLTDPEVFESRYPVRLVRFEIRRGSGGAGRFRGGNGVVREIEFLRSLQVSILSQRRLKRPYGLHGGNDGSVGRNTLVRNLTGKVEILPPIVSVDVQIGDVLTIETPGGGGWGKLSDGEESRA